MSKPHRVQDFRRNEWKYGHPSSTWTKKLGLRRNKGRKDFSAAFREEFKDVLDSPEEPLGKRYMAYKEKNKAPFTPPLPNDVKTLVDETLGKYELHPDFDFLHRLGLATAKVVYDSRSNINLDGQFRNFLDFVLYYAIREGRKDIPVGELFHRFGQLEGKSATERILQERKSEYELFGVDGAQQPIDGEVKKFRGYIEYLADRYAFSGVDITKLIDAGVYGAKRAISKFGIDGDSPEHRGLVLSHINWYIQQASNLSPEQRVKMPKMRELAQGYDDKQVYELKLAEEEEERQHEIHGKHTTFNRFLRKFLNQTEYNSIEEKIRHARESLDENSDPLVAAANLVTENIPRYKGKNAYDFKFGSHWPEELKRHTLEKLRHILTEERGIPVDRIPSAVNTYLIDELGFRNFRIGVYKGRTTELINDLYQGRFKPWEFRSPMGGVKGGRGDIWARGGVELFNEATRWLVEEKLCSAVEESPEKLTIDVYEQYGLGNALKRFFDGSPMHALAAAYPNRFNPEDFIKVLEKRQQFPVDNDLLTELIASYERFMWGYASRYFRGLTKESQPLLGHLIDIDDLVQEGRRGIWEAMRDHEMTAENAQGYRPLITAYIKNKIKHAVFQVYRKNDVLSVSDSLDRLVYTHGQEGSTRTLGETIGFEDDALSASEETSNKATHEYLYPLQESLGKKSERFIRLLTDTMSEEEFKSMNKTIYETQTKLENSYIWNRADFDPVDEAMKLLEAVPRFKAIQKWELKAHPWRTGGSGEGGRATPLERYKGAELARAATRWLYEANLGVPVSKIPQVANTRIFQANGLGGMLIQVYDGSAWAATEDAYRGRWKPWEFKNSPHLWERDDAYEIARAAVRWLVEEKLQTTPDKVTKADFHRHKLAGMLSQLNMGVRGAIRNAYPEIYDPKRIEQLRSFLRQNIPAGLYSLMPEQVILNKIPATEEWDPIDVGIQLMARIDPEYNTRPVWQFRYNNEPGKRYSKTLVARGIRDLVKREGIQQEDIPLHMTKETIEAYGMAEAVNELFGGSVFSAIDSVYPHQYKPWDFDRKDSKLDIALPTGRANVPSWRKYNIIVIPTGARRYFPGYKKPFVLETDIGPIEVWMSSSNNGLPSGDPNGGKYIVGVPKRYKTTEFPSLSEWYGNHGEIKSGNVLSFTRLNDHRYGLSIFT